MKRLELIKERTHFTALNDEERRQLRESLLAHMNKVPVQVKEEFLFEQPGRFSWVVGVAAGLLIAGVAVMLIASAATQGDWLYPIKTSVSDRVLGFFNNSKPITPNTVTASETNP
jgi:hypothetical protein